MKIDRGGSEINVSCVETDRGCSEINGSGAEKERLDVNIESFSLTRKYKDRYSFLCSTRWWIVGYLFLSFMFLFMHRVNLSLAVVCMVDTTNRPYVSTAPNVTETVDVVSIHNGTTESEGYVLRNVSLGQAREILLSSCVTGASDDETKEGAVVPAGMSILNSWATPNERSVMIAFLGSGLLAGAIITFQTSGLLCAYGFDNGWPSIFYIHGIVTGLFVVLWLVEAHSRPEDHPRISTEELHFIQTSRPHAKPNGLYSSLPYVFQIVSAIICSKLSVIVIKTRCLSPLATRRTFNTVSLVGIGICLVCAGYISCEKRYVAVILLCLSCTFAGFVYGGFIANHPEYAGQFAGTAFGITNAGAVISSMVASVMPGLLTPNGLQEEWQTVFYIAAGVNLFGSVMFVLLVDVNLQPWAGKLQSVSLKVEADEETVEMKPYDHGKS